MHSNFSACPHCAAQGRERRLRPATARTPHVSRSDGRSFHLFLEESHLSRPHGSAEEEIQALFRYDLDSANVKAESTLVIIRPAGDTSEGGLAQLERAADRLADALDKGRPLSKTYTWSLEQKPAD